MFCEIPILRCENLKNWKIITIFTTIVLIITFGCNVSHKRNLDTNINFKDSLNFRIALKKARNYETIPFDSALIFWNQAFKIAEKNNYIHGEIRAVGVYSILGIIQGEGSVTFNNANGLIDSFLLLCKSKKDWEPYLYYAFYTKASFLLLQNKFDSAEKYFIQSLKLNQSDSEIYYNSCSGISHIYYTNNEFENARKYQILFLNHIIPEKDTEKILQNLVNLSSQDLHLNDGSAAFHDLNLMKQFLNNDTVRFFEPYFMYNYNLGWYFENEKNLDSSLKYLLNTLHLIEKNESLISPYKALTLVSIGEIFRQKGNLKDAEYYWLQVDTNHLLGYDQQRAKHSYYILGSELFAAKKNYLATLVMIEKANLIYDKIKDTEMSEELFKREKELKKLSGEKIISQKNEQIAKQKQRNHLFIFITLLFVLINIGLMINYRSQKKMEYVAHERLLLQTQLDERNRIAREMHDDLGTTLTSVNMSIELLKSNPDDQSKIARLQENILQMHQQMNEVIWRLNLRNDTLESLILFIHRFAKKFISEAGIKIEVNSGKIPDKKVETQTRHLIYLVIKEILNNIVKHSAANKVLITIQYFDSVLKFSIADDGEGFNPKNIMETAGNGLKNIKENISKLGGEIEWLYGNGTVVNIELSI